jgi:hypothetical protein
MMEFAIRLYAANVVANMESIAALYPGVTELILGEDR